VTLQEEQPPPPDIVAQGCETPDVSNRGLLIFFVSFLILCAVIIFGMWGLLKLYIAQPRIADQTTSAAPQPDRFAPPDLQPIQKHNQLPYQDLQDLRREKDALLIRMGWTIDPRTGAAEIPDAVVNQLAQKEKPK
jgi:hypothetical protein